MGPPRSYRRANSFLSTITRPRIPSSLRRLTGTALPLQLPFLATTPLSIFVADFTASYHSQLVPCLLRATTRTLPPR